MKQIFFVISLLMFISCNSEVKNSTKSILTVLNKQVKEWNNGDIEGYMQGYWNSDSLRFSSGRNVTYGWKKTLSNYKKAYSNRELMGTLKFDEIKIEFITDSDAIVMGRWQLKRTNDNPEGLFTLIFKFIDGKWKITHDHTSSGN